MRYLKVINVVFLGLLLGSFITTNSLADQVQISWPATHGYDGAFDVTVLDGPLGAAGFVFQSFCIETDESISYPTYNPIYNYSLSMYAVAGGSGGPDPDPISIGTAWLYSKFSANTLPGYSATISDQNELQTAFWVLEQEVTIPSSFSAYGRTTGDNKFLGAALTGLTLGDLEDLQAKAGASNFGVVAMNLTDGRGNLKQSMLALGVPTPEPGMLILMGFGVLAVAGMCRRKR